MDRILPYENSYSTLKKWRNWGTVTIYLTSSLSVLIPLINYYCNDQSQLMQILNYFNFILIISYYIINIVCEAFLTPSTARLRRIGFVDNSFGSKFTGQELKNYFSNDSIPVGAFKMAVNCFENCFFTYNISKSMTARLVFKNAFFFLIFITTAYFGFKDNKIGLPILQIFLSSLFITDLIYHLFFVSNLKELLERFKLFFIGVDERNSRQEIHYPVLLLLDYETILAYNKSPLSDKVYKSLNEKLSAEWEHLKQYYKIKQ